MGVTATEYSSFPYPQGYGCQCSIWETTKPLFKLIMLTPYHSIVSKGMNNPVQSIAIWLKHHDENMLVIIYDL